MPQLNQIVVQIRKPEQRSLKAFQGEIEKINSHYQRCYVPIKVALDD